MWRTLAFAQVSGCSKSFYESVQVWLLRPNVCNKIVSCSVLENRNCSGNEINPQLDISISSKIVAYAMDLFALSKLSKCPKCHQVYNFENNFDKDVFHYFRKLVPRHHDLHLAGFEYVIATPNCFIFIPFGFTAISSSNNAFAYMICYCNSCTNREKAIKSTESSKECHVSASGVLTINVIDYHELSSYKFYAEEKSCKANEKLSNCLPTKAWIQKKLFPSLCKWCRDESKKSNANLQLPPSLSLLNQEKYSLLYHTLKMKYGVSIAQVWPEVTDPQKFVYEDVAIATYLLLLWEKERNLLGIESKQTFADLGCGNGLLVHILTSEGHDGIGYDVRKRKIWDMFNKSTKLMEATVTPDNLEMLERYDWLLGNHSDELTPWIPVMATRCGYNKRYWVLPCCFFDLHGKYERSQSLRSQYDDYLSYVKSLGEKCGHLVDVDVMRIPSTKRVCFVGMTRSYDESQHDDVKSKVERLIANKLIASRQPFIARPAEIKVQNCTKIDRGIQSEVVEKISTHLLSHVNLIRTTEGADWNRGGRIAIAEAMQLLSDDVRATLKSENGGLQTLLRNNHQVFEVSGGYVQVRNWASTDTDSHRRKKKRKKENTIMAKTRRCWFHDCHPNGCPRSPHDCSFLHSE